MPFLIEAALFALPFLLFWLWRRIWPGAADAAPGWFVPLALAGIGLMLASASFYGLGRSLGRGERYVPARLAPDGAVRPGGGVPGGAEPGWPLRPGPALVPPATAGTDAAAPPPAAAAPGR